MNASQPRGSAKANWTFVLQMKPLLELLCFPLYVESSLGPRCTLPVHSSLSCNPGRRLCFVSSWEYELSGNSRACKLCRSDIPARMPLFPVLQVLLTDLSRDRVVRGLKNLRMDALKPSCYPSAERKLVHHVASCRQTRHSKHLKQLAPTHSGADKSSRKHFGRVRPVKLRFLI